MKISTSLSSDSDDVTFSSKSILSTEEMCSSDVSGEMEIVGHVQSHGEELLVRPSNEDDVEEGKASLSLAVLRARFAWEISVNAW